MTPDLARIVGTLLRISTTGLCIRCIAREFLPCAGTLLVIVFVRSAWCGRSESTYAAVHVSACSLWRAFAQMQYCESGKGGGEGGRGGESV